MNQAIIQCPACGTKNRIPPDKRHLRAKCGRCGRSLPGTAGGTVIELDDMGFDRFIRDASLPVLVDFFSPSCGPCRMLAPVIDDIAHSFAGRVLVAKLDTSRHQMTAGRYNIRGVPTLLFFRQGRVVEQLVGAVPQGRIEESIRAML